MSLEGFTVSPAGGEYASAMDVIKIEQVAFGPGGRLFASMRLPSLADWPAVLQFASPYFVCLVVADGTTETTDELSAWAARALEQGMVYACAWGDGCDVVEDVVDWAFIARDSGGDRPIVLTTSHRDEPVEAAVDFFITDALPVDAYRTGCSTWLLVEVGQAGATSGALEHLVSEVA